MIQYKQKGDGKYVLIKKKILFGKWIAAAMILICLPWLFLGIVGMMLSISSFLGFGDSIERAETGAFASGYISVLLFFGVLTWLGIRTFWLAGYANQFNTLFESGPDGVLSVKQIDALAANSPKKKDHIGEERRLPAC